MAYLIGIVLALAICGLAVVAKLDRDRALYPVMLIVIASYYVLFAVMGGGTEALLREILAAIVFTACALVAFRRSLWIAVAGMAAHGLFDFTHSLFIPNPGVPDWWPGFCLAFDVTAAAFLGALLLRRARPSSRAEAVR